MVVEYTCVFAVTMHFQESSYVHVKKKFGGNDQFSFSRAVEASKNVKKSVFFSPFFDDFMKLKSGVGYFFLCLFVPLEKMTKKHFFY